jgi:hypothetical protein
MKLFLFLLGFILGVAFGASMGVGIYEWIRAVIGYHRYTKARP